MEFLLTKNERLAYVEEKSGTGSAFINLLRAIFHQLNLRIKSKSKPEKMDLHFPEIWYIIPVCGQKNSIHRGSITDQMINPHPP